MMAKAGEEAKKDGDEGEKYCPIMTAGNVGHTDGMQDQPRQYRALCMGKKCGIWSDYYGRCGLISLS